MPVRGDLGTINGLKRRIAEFPKTVAHEVAQRAAPAMTTRTRNAFSSGQTVYGAARPAGVGGNALTLHDSGATESQLRFVANGTVVRCVLGPRWAKYLIGKYAILPMGALPAAWSGELRGFVNEAGKRLLQGAP